jgi:hypothetical protein
MSLHSCSTMQRDSRRTGWCAALAIVGKSHAREREKEVVAYFENNSLRQSSQIILTRGSILLLSDEKRTGLICLCLAISVWWRLDFYAFFVWRTDNFLMVYFTTLSVSRLYSVEWQDDRWIGKDLEGSGLRLVEVLSLEGLKKTTKDLSQYPVSRPSTSWIQL